MESALKAAGSLATHLRHRDVEYVRDWLDVDHVYSTSPPIAVGHDLEGTLGKKDFCWSYEQEYRLILIVPTSEPVGELLVPISGCVKRLYCGVRVTAAGRLVAAAFARAFELSSLDVMEQTALGLQATEEPIPGS